MYLYLRLMPLPCIDIKNYFFDIFGNCHNQLNFAVIFRVNEGKYQNILPTPIFANSPGCMLIGIILRVEMIMSKIIMLEMLMSEVLCQK